MSLRSIAFSSIGAKVIMALTGLLLFLFVLQHLVSNLQLFLGPDALNAYAHWIKNQPVILWGGRFGLLVVFALHVAVGAWLSARNAAARPTHYQLKKPVASSFASRQMLVSGLALFAFIAFHLLHLTLGVVAPENFDLHDALGRHDVYSMTVRGFQNPWLVGSYVIAMALLGLHLAHGASSLFQSVGARTPRAKQITDKAGPVFALLIVLGNTAMPLAAFFRLVNPVQ